MNENLDLTKILEGCPAGTEFYCPLCGNLRLVKINSSLIDAVELCIDEDNPLFTFSREGYFYYTYRNRSIECLLFPSKDQRDWSKFERFWDKQEKADKFDPNTFKPFDKILVRKVYTPWNISPWSCEYFNYIYSNTRHLVNGISSRYDICIPYNKDTKHLVGTKDDCPEYYKWWEE